MRSAPARARAVPAMRQPHGRERAGRRLRRCSRGRSRTGFVMRVCFPIPWRTSASGSAASSRAARRRARRPAFARRRYAHTAMARTMGGGIVQQRGDDGAAGDSVPAHCRRRSGSCAPRGRGRCASRACRGSACGRRCRRAARRSARGGLSSSALTCRRASCASLANLFQGQTARQSSQPKMRLPIGSRNSSGIWPLCSIVR